MCDRGVQVFGFAGHLLLGLFVFHVTNAPHCAQALGCHDKDYTYVFGKTYEQVSEILSFYNRRFRVQFFYPLHSFNDVPHVFAEFPLNFFKLFFSVYYGSKHAAYHCVCAKVYFSS